MPLFDISGMKPLATSTEPALIEIAPTSFADQGIQERQHLQAALRDCIDVIGDDLFVVAEEFGDFDGANRRIDLLCIDRAARLVVVELKRTSDGGHMELQALRYAAMISTMTFAQVVRAHARYRRSRGAEEFTESDAEEELLAWLDEDVDDAAIAREVGIVLASEDFSQEITTTVLWLNEFHDFDIRCVRLSTYSWDERVLLDVQQVVPLPEASEYTVRVREKEVVARQAKGSSNLDTTKFVVRKPSGDSEPLPKRWAILELVRGMAETGVGMERIKPALPNSKLIKVIGVFDGPESLWSAVQAQHDKPKAKRWHLNDPVVVGEDSWVVHSNWGTQTRAAFHALLKVAPPGFDVLEGDTSYAANG